jgi:hypothetical protein
MSDAEILQAAILRHHIASPGGAPTPDAVRALAIVYCLREAEYARRQSARRSGHASIGAALTTAEAVVLLQRRAGRPRAGQLATVGPTANVTDDDLLAAAMDRHGVVLANAGRPGAEEIRSLAVLLAKREAQRIDRERARKAGKPTTTGPVTTDKAARALRRRPGRPARRDLSTVVTTALAGIDWATSQDPTIPVAEIASTIADDMQARDRANPDPTYLGKSVRRIRKSSRN